MLGKAGWGGEIEAGSLGADASFWEQGGGGERGKGETEALASVCALVVGDDYTMSGRECCERLG